MSAQEQTNTPMRGRGRPPKIHDNSRVQAVLMSWSIAGSISRPAWLNDIITGAACLGTGDAKNRSQRPLCAALIFNVLRNCPVIYAASVASVIGHHYSRSQTDRYTAAARVASKGITAELCRRPEWVAQVAEGAAHMAGFEATIGEL